MVRPRKKRARFDEPTGERRKRAEKMIADALVEGFRKGEPPRVPCLAEIVDLLDREDRE